MRICVYEQPVVSWYKFNLFLHSTAKDSFYVVLNDDGAYVQQYACAEAARLAVTCPLVDRNMVPVKYIRRV